MQCTVLEIDINWLKYIASEITEGNISLSNAAKMAQFVTSYGIKTNSILESTLRFHLNRNSIHYEAKKGRRHTTVSKEKEDLILKFQKEFNCGETVTFNSLLAEYPNINSNDVRGTFIKYNLYQYKIGEKAEKIRCGYEAMYVNQICHADIHFFTDIDSVEHNIYAILDDRSRFIVGIKVVSKKFRSIALKF